MTKKKNEADRPSGASAGVGRCKRLLAALVLGFCAFVFVSISSAQVLTLPTIKNKTRNPKPKVVSFHGDVMNFTNAAITVRDRKNFALLRTFSYTPALARKLENRRMETGDRVTVRYMQGTETAVGLNGKLRKSDSPYLLKRRK